VGTVVTQICALRFFCRYVLKRRDVREDLPYPKQRPRNPHRIVHRRIARTPDRTRAAAAHASIAPQATAVHARGS
jgi:hypothetical protein